MRFAKALLVLLAAPLIGVIAANHLLDGYPLPFPDGGAADILEYCTARADLARPGWTSACREVLRVALLRDASLASAFMGVLVLIGFAAAAAWAGTDRVRITRVFPPLVVVSLVIAVVLVVSHGIIATATAWLIDGSQMGPLFFMIAVPVTLGVVIGVIGLTRALASLLGREEHAVLGQALSPDAQPRLFAFVRDIADALGARPPDQVIVGLEPNFFVTSARVRLIGEGSTFSGETLYMSLPLMRIFTRDEIRAVIGHELGHFRGQDTYYSLRFAPVYAGLSHGVAAMGAGQDLMHLARLPARVLLRYMIDVFHRNVSTIGRSREFEADRIATSVAPPLALATSLLKIGLYANAWHALLERVVARMAERKAVHNLSSLFASIVRYDVDEARLPDALAAVAGQTVAHPTDSHPSTAARIERAGIDIAGIDHDLLRPGGSGSIDLVADPLVIEEKLTVVQQQYFVAMGVQVPQAPDPAADQSGTLLAALGAHMVLADGVVDPAEIDHAELIGMRMSATFDVIEFREFCHYPTTIPTVDHLLEAARDVSGEAKRAVFDYLETIAMADRDTSPEERALLATVRRAFGDAWRA